MKLCRSPYLPEHLEDFSVNTLNRTLHVQTHQVQFKYAAKVYIYIHSFFLTLTIALSEHLALPSRQFPIDSVFSLSSDSTKLALAA